MINEYLSELNVSILKGSPTKPFSILILCLTLFTAHCSFAADNPPALPSATVTPSGPMVTTLAGCGGAGYCNGTGTRDVAFNQPYDVAVDNSGNVYVADTENNMIRKITPGGVVTILAGSKDGVGRTDTSFNGPIGVAADKSGNVYVAESVSCLIRKITSAGVVTTLAGSGSEGKTNGKENAASFNDPYSVAVDASGNVYVADYGNNLIRKITPAGLVTTLAGSGLAGSVDAKGTAASFNGPTGVAVDASGNVYVGDSGNHLIRKITPAGLVKTLAGSAGISGFRNGSSALFKDPSGIAVDASGNVYVADYGNNLIRKITSAGLVTTLAGSTGVTGANNGIGTAALFHGPFGVTVDPAGNVYVADTGNELIRKITP